MFGEDIWREPTYRVYQAVAPIVLQNELGHADDNSCIEGSIIGGIAGGGAGAAMSRGDGRWWAIPLGVVGGSIDVRSMGVDNEERLDLAGRSD